MRKHDNGCEEAFRRILRLAEEDLFSAVWVLENYGNVAGKRVADKILRSGIGTGSSNGASDELVSTLEFWLGFCRRKPEDLIDLIEEEIKSPFPEFKDLVRAGISVRVSQPNGLRFGEGVPPLNCASEKLRVVN